MTTKAPPGVKEFPPDALEKIAYKSVEGVQTVEPNDRNRLGYHIWRWLRTKEGTLEHAVVESGARLLVTADDAVTIVRDGLTKQGIAA